MNTLVSTGSRAAQPLDQSDCAVVERLEWIVIDAARPDFRQERSLARQLAWRAVGQYAVCRLEFNLASLEPVCQAFRQAGLASGFFRPAEAGKQPLDLCKDPN